MPRSYTKSPTAQRPISANPKTLSAAGTTRKWRLLCQCTLIACPSVSLYSSRYFPITCTKSISDLITITRVNVSSSVPRPWESEGGRRGWEKTKEGKGEGGGKRGGEREGQTRLNMFFNNSRTPYPRPISLTFIDSCNFSA